MNETYVTQLRNYLSLIENWKNNSEVWNNFTGFRRSFSAIFQEFNLNPQAIQYNRRGKPLPHLKPISDPDLRFYLTDFRNDLLNALAHYSGISDLNNPEDPNFLKKGLDNLINNLSSGADNSNYLSELESSFQNYIITLEKYKDLPDNLNLLNFLTSVKETYEKYLNGEKISLENFSHQKKPFKTKTPEQRLNQLA